MIPRFLAPLLLTATTAVAATDHPVPDDPRWLTYPGGEGPGEDKHIVLIAADQVGYESSSQFSREFKRYFGQSPAEMMRELRAA